MIRLVVDDGYQVCCVIVEVIMSSCVGDIVCGQWMDVSCSII